MNSQQRDYISEAQQLKQSYNNLLTMNEEEQNPIVEKEKNAYLYPTLIALPLLIAIIIVIASNIQLAVKILLIGLLIISMIFFYMERKHVDLLKYIKKRPAQPNT